MKADDRQCAACGKRYPNLELRWYVLGRGEAEFMFCSQCTIDHRALPIPFQCLFPAYATDKLWSIRQSQPWEWDDDKSD